MNVHSMYKYLSQIITQHLPAEELGKARNVLDTLKGQHMDALQPSPAPAAADYEVLCSIVDPDMVAHKAYDNCKIESPHNISECGIWLDPAPAAWIRQVKDMIAYAEATGFWTEDNEIPTDDIFAILDRIAALNQTEKQDG